jgi:hypothetical protein
MVEHWWRWRPGGGGTLRSSTCQQYTVYSIYTQPDKTQYKAQCDGVGQGLAYDDLYPLGAHWQAAESARHCYLVTR